MPNIMKYFFDISFSQDRYIYDEFEDKLLFIFNKFVAANDKNITDEGITGLCAALSAEYLIQVRQGGLEQGINYLESIKNLTKILVTEISPYDPPYIKANLQAKKIHAQERFNRLLITLASRQRASFDMLDIACYYPAYSYWPAKNPSESLSNYIKKVVAYESEVQSLYKDRYWFKEFFLEIGRQVDNDSYNTEEIKFFANNALLSLKKRYFEKYIDYYNNRGLKTINSSQKYILNEININEFIERNIDVDDIDKNKYFEFCSQDHMMAIVIEKDSKTGKLIYAFFDPNYGVIKTDNKDVFIEFLNYIVKVRDDVYNFIHLQDDSINVFASEMEYDEHITESSILPKIDDNLVDITTNKILCENENTFILGLKTKIIFKQFNDNSRTTTIQLISEKNEQKNINIIVDSLSAEQIIKLFTNQYKNILQLSDNNIHIRITNENYEIRKITNVSDIIYHLSNSRELLEFYLSDPIASLPRKQLPVELLELHYKEVLGDREPIKLDKWWDPRIDSALIQFQNHTELTQSQLANADPYNIVIQLAEDDITSKAAANLIAKHPTNTILIQYDLANNQHRVVYGDITKVVRGNSRWLLVGHGRFDELHQQRLLANHNAYDIVDKLKELKEKILANIEPEKIVLLGCKLAQGNVLNNFALNISQEFWRRGFKSTLVAYTKDLYIHYNGRKQVYLHDDDADRQPAKYYKNQYIKDPNSGEITVNGESLILSILRQINAGDVSLSAVVSRYRDYLSQYFYYPNGQLDLDLLKTIAYDDKAYKIFTDNFVIDDQIINNYDIGVLIDNLHGKNIDNVPLWPKVNAANITSGSSQTLDENSPQIIFRFSGDKKFRQQAELLAKRLPENTFIFQVDKNSNTAILEYGELDKLNNIEIKKWLLLGNIVNYDEQSLFEGLLSTKLVDILSEVKLYFGLNIPAEVCFFSQDGLGKLANVYDPSGIASETVKNLASRAINTTVTTYENNHLPLLSSNILYENNILIIQNNKLKRFDYNSETQQLYINKILIQQYLLMNIVTDKIDFNKNSHKYSYHLQGYVTDENDLLDINRINQIKYDPILNKKVNNYFEKNKYIESNALIEWRKLFFNNELPTVQQQAYDAKILLENIVFRSEIIHYLSDYSNNLLSQLFSYPDGTINTRELMLLIHDHQALENLKSALIELASIDKRSELSRLTLGQALVKSQQWHSYYFSNIINLAKRTDTKAIPLFNITINPISHAFHFEKNNQLGKILGLFYAYNENNREKTSELLQYHYYLLASSTKKSLNNEELKFIEDFDNTINNIDFLLTQNKAINEKNIDQQQKLFIGKYQLTIDNYVFTILVKKKDNDFYDYIIFDPKMGEIKLNSIPTEKAYEELLYFMQMYLDDEIIIDNVKYHRYEILGIKKDRQNNYQFKLYEIQHDAILNYKLERLIQQLPITENQQENQPLVKFGEIDIPFALLQQAGAYIENKKLTLFSTRNIADWQHKIQFDVMALNDYLSFYQANKDNINFIKILKEKISSTKNYNEILINSDNLNDLAVIIQRLAYIDRYDNQSFATRNLSQKLQQGLSQLPRYAPLINKLSHAMQLVGVTQLVSSTQSIVMQLNNPGLADNERKMLENSLIIAWAAGLTNFSSQALQPLLLKFSYKKEGPVGELGTFASRVNAGLTLASTGFDLYYAYENFSQLKDEHDPAIRQDLIVNGTLSLINAGVSVSTALAILAGSSTAGPLGVITGAGLMLSGMFYNAYRVIERVEEKVELSLPEKLQLGVSALLGLQPTYSIQNKLLQQQTESELKLYRQQFEEDFFKQVLQPAGYNLSIIAEEEENIAELPLYHLFDKKTNSYLTDKKYKDFQYDLQYLKHDLNIVTLTFNLWHQQQIDQTLEAIKRKFTKQEVEKIIVQYPNRYQVELAKIKTYIPVSSESSDEMILLTSKYNHVIKLMINQPYITKNLLNIDKVNTIYSLLLNNKIEYFNESLDDFLLKNRLENYIIGINFNLANGNDTIVGSQTIKNQFICGNGKKIFIGGELDDVFILLFDKLKIDENKYFDGNNGNDTLYIEQLPYYPLATTDNIQEQVNNLTKVVGTFINLQQGELRYLIKNYSDNFSDIQSLINKNYMTDVSVDFISIENVIASKNSQDLILGNEKDNILNGNGGVDILYGKAGKDTLILNNGYANSGSGQDTYIIERYNWLDYQDELPWVKQHYFWDADNEQWQNLVNNKTESKLGYDFNVNIVIDEVEKENRSIVALNYKLDEIITVKLVDSDVYLQILTNESQIDSEVKVNQVNLRLKNVYLDLGDEYILNHEYLLQTMNGFLLSMCLPKKLKEHTMPEKIFETMYFKKLDKDNKDISFNQIEIDLTKNTIKNYQKNYLLPDMVKPMISINNAQYTVFHGDKSNNYFTSIKKNNYIYFSHGIDIYLIDNLGITDNIGDSITFDFKEITNSYTNEDIFILILKDRSGYDFAFDNNNLYYQGSIKLPTIKFVNNIGNFYGKIYLLDKNNQYFFIDYQDNHYQITPCTTVLTPSEFDDNIFYPKGYSQIIKVNLSTGNDIFTDMSEIGKIILAGEGNDIITVKSGNNLVIDGNGDDIISTGDGNDIIISTQGNNIINAGTGNNVLAINHDTGDINVLLNEGNNKIFIQGLGGGAVFDYPDNNLVISSRNNSSKITIYDYKKYKDNIEINTQLNSDILFDEKDIELLINMASAFQQKNSESLFTDLTVNEKNFVNQIFQYNKMT